MSNEKNKTLNGKENESQSKLHEPDTYQCLIYIIIICIIKNTFIIWGFPGDTVVKSPSANAGDARMQVESLGQEDPLE